MRSVAEIFSALKGAFTPFGGLALAIAFVLLLVLRLLMPADNRRQLRAPFMMVVVHLGLVMLLAVLPEPHAHDTFTPLARKVVRLSALTVLLVAIGRSFYLVLLHTLIGRRGTPYRSLPGIFRDIVQVAIYLVVALFVLNAAGVEAGSLLTTSALLTAVIGFALQDTLGNLFAGLAIQTQQPFEVGDWIQYDGDASNVGEVLEINWRAARLLTLDRVEIVVPNSMLAKAAIKNFSKPTPLARRQVTVVAPLDTPPARIHRLLAEAAKDVEGVRAQPPPDVQTVAFTDRGVEYNVRFFIDSFEQRQMIESRVRDRVWYALRRAAVPIPPPLRRLTIVEQNAASAERDSQAQIADVEKALARIPLFKPLSGELLHELAIHVERRLYAPGELVIQQGDYGEELFIVERGSVEVLIDAHGALEHVATLGPRDFFGEMSLMTGEQRKATVRTKSEVALLVVSKVAIQPILEAYPALITSISDVLAQRELELGRHSNRPEDSVEEVMTERRGELLSRIRQFFSL